MDRGQAHNAFGGSASAGAVVQAGSIIGDVHIAVSTAASAPGSAAEDHDLDTWSGRVARSTVWKLVRQDSKIEHHRELATRIARTLAEMCDAIPQPEVADPWSDPTIADRYLENVEWLLARPTTDLDLYPAEAAVIVLFPFLYRAHMAQQAARIVPQARPWSLETVPCPHADRKAFEAFANGHRLLVQRARRNPQAEAGVGWWLFHRWFMARREFADAGSLRELLSRCGEDVRAMGDVLEPDMLSAFLYGLRHDPERFDSDFIRALRPSERVRSGPELQRIHHQRAALLLAFAYKLSVEMATVPPVVVEHLVTPFPVEVAALEQAVVGSTWSGPPEVAVLRAKCGHEAIVEALREYVAAADELLRAARRFVHDRVGMPALPVRLSADDVESGSSAFDNYAKFQGDVNRLLGLVMGVELYKDRDLAVRELYQNALDACRYRRARIQYLNRPGKAVRPYAYEGRIEFAQGVDENGRAYLDCIDNGVGMGEVELRRLFARAGSRFTEENGFRLEYAAWESVDPPIRLYPNSRFGIGVFSYFMLAEEIQVTTCLMKRDGSVGAMIEAAICGPNHLFRIQKIAPHGSEPGTRVRLYLREEIDHRTWSCTKILKSVLAIAEFATTATCREETVEWKPGELRYRDERHPGRGHALDLRGPLWRAEGLQDADVYWCREGGALLVDGLLVVPTVRRGVFSDQGTGLDRVVVNLRGSLAPEQLSADRGNVIDDVAARVAELLAAAAPAVTEYAASPPSLDWFSTVAQGNPVLGDIMAAALTRSGRVFTAQDMEIGPASGGYLFADLGIVPDDPEGVRRNIPPTARTSHSMPDHIYLWRILAHRPERALRELADLCPDILDVGPLRPVRPSDLWLTGISRRGGVVARSQLNLNDVWSAAVQLADSPRDIALRLTSLGMPGVDFHAWSPEADLSSALSEAIRAESPLGLSVGKAVTPWQLDSFARRLGVGPEDAAPLLRRFAFHVSVEAVEICKAAGHDPLLCWSEDSSVSPDIRLDRPVPAGYVASVSLDSGMPVSEVCSRLQAYGLRADSHRLPEHPTEDVVRMLRIFTENSHGLAHWLDRTDGASPAHVLDLADELDLDPREVSTVLSGLGFPCCPVPPDASVEEDAWVFVDEINREDPWPPDDLMYFQVFHGVDDLGELEFRIARLRAYGYDVPLSVPKQPTALDREILFENAPFVLWWAKTCVPLPFGHVVIAARELSVSAEELAGRLDAMGVPMTMYRLPPDLSAIDALRLMDAVEWSDDGNVPEESTYTLSYIHHTATKMGMTVARVAELLTMLGVADLHPADMIRAALPRIPRAE